MLAHRLVLLFRRLLAALFEPDANPVVHLAAGGDALAAKVALGGAAPIQHDGGGPAQPGQLVPQPFRCLGVRRAVAGAVQDHPRPGQQDGGAAPGVPVLRGVAEGLARPSGGRQQLHAAEVGSPAVVG